MANGKLPLVGNVGAGDIGKITSEIKHFKNPWGVQGGPNIQRTDLWQVDFTAVIQGLNQHITTDLSLPSLPEGLSGSLSLPRLPEIPRFYPAAITLPELKIKAEHVRRDSRIYPMPSWDEPLESIKMVFLVDDGGAAHMSSIYAILDVWRTVVRAGRGAVGAEREIYVNSRYQIAYGFPVYIYLAKGTDPPPSSQWDYNTIPGFQLSGIYRLENTWLSSFRINNLTYERSGVLTIDAVFYADNIFQDRTGFESDIPSLVG